MKMKATDRLNSSNEKSTTSRQNHRAKKVCDEEPVVSLALPCLLSFAPSYIKWHLEQHFQIVLIPYQNIIIIIELGKPNQSVLRFVCVGRQGSFNLQPPLDLWFRWPLS